MSLGYPPLRPRPDGSTLVSSQKDGSMGVPEVMYHGFQSVRNELGPSHALQYSEANWDANKEKMDFAMLRNMQGLHAPLRLQMERNTARRFGRLPGLHSSNIMIDTLTGRLDTIDYEDVLNAPADAETMTNTHTAVEKKLNLL